jgi:uncharacterized protein (DUF1800 family)
MTRSTRTRAAAVVALVAVGAMAAVLPAANVPSDRAAVEHALSRLTFGARPGDVEHVEKMGLGAWIDQQLTPSRVDDTAISTKLPPLPDKPASVNSPQEARRYGREAVQVLAQQKVLRAVYSERQLEEVLVDFWFNHFNVFAGKGRTSLFIPEYERDAIRPHVFGKFRDLLTATAKSPAMLFYLDNWLSADPQAAARLETQREQRRTARGLSPQQNGQQRRRGLNENYGRELLELHTLGVDGGYTQQDVIEVARAFTGWTIGRPEPAGARRGLGRRGRAALPAPDMDLGDAQFRFVGALHDTGEKVVLGQHIKSGGGIEDGERVLAIVAAHPSTARHVATKLVRRFVSDDPPEALVARVAARFRETDGDLREVVRAVVTSPEFFAANTRHVKMKTPFEFVASAMRATGRDVSDARPLLRALQQLGMAPYMCQPPTGYDDTAETWITAGALVTRMNVAQQIAGADGATRIGGPEFQRR